LYFIAPRLLLHVRKAREVALPDLRTVVRVTYSWLALRPFSALNPASVLLTQSHAA
jgi:hypothetical protein